MGRSTDSRRYFRVSPTIWRKKLAWGEDGTTLALYVLTCEHRITEGLYRLPSSYALSDLRWEAKPKRFKAALDALSADGFVRYDYEHGVILILKALEWQAPENPNQVKAAVRKVKEEVPAETPLLQEFYGLAERLAPSLAEGLVQGFPERFGEGLPEPLTEPLPERLGEPPSPPPTPSPKSALRVVEGDAGARSLEQVPDPRLGGDGFSSGRTA